MVLWWPVTGGLASIMWSEEAGVQVLASRTLNRLASEDWARNSLGQLYLDVETQAWADNVDAITNHRDSKGVSLAQRKDLWVKGARFTAKRGTTVRGISLVQDNDDHIKGRVDGQRIVILTEFVKKK